MKKQTQKKTGATSTLVSIFGIRHRTFDTFIRRWTASDQYTKQCSRSKTSLRNILQTSIQYTRLRVWPQRGQEYTATLLQYIGEKQITTVDWGYVLYHQYVLYRLVRVGDSAYTAVDEDSIYNAIFFWRCENVGLYCTIFSTIFSTIRNRFRICHFSIKIGVWLSYVS